MIGVKVILCSVFLVHLVSSQSNRFSGRQNSFGQNLGGFSEDSVLVPEDYDTSQAGRDDFDFPPVGQNNRPNNRPNRPNNQPNNPNFPNNPNWTPRPDVSTSTIAVPGAETPRTPCEMACQLTPEYNPVCASNQMTYANPGMLRCAQNCGKRIQMVHYGQCGASG